MSSSLLSIFLDKGRLEKVIIFLFLRIEWGVVILGDDANVFFRVEYAFSIYKCFRLWKDVGDWKFLYAGSVSFGSVYIYLELLIGNSD